MYWSLNEIKVCLKYEQGARFIKICHAEYCKEKRAENLEYVLKQLLKKTMAICFSTASMIKNTLFLHFTFSLQNPLKKKRVFKYLHLSILTYYSPVLLFKGYRKVTPGGNGLNCTCPIEIK